MTVAITTAVTWLCLSLAAFVAWTIRVYTTTDLARHDGGKVKDATTALIWYVGKVAVWALAAVTVCLFTSAVLAVFVHALGGMLR